ncbi:unnamed protein product [Staurois parvus]|uniref:Uncharacterized protein n=1 Tax=Staurois parvus TaxID=386267 RepID=A0ABN9FIS1_9NEOB|nr:unnamed protein product [Staurois parvus]
MRQYSNKTIHEGFEGPALSSLQSRREGIVVQEEVAVGDGVVGGVEEIGC